MRMVNFGSACLRFPDAVSNFNLCLEVPLSAPPWQHSRGILPARGTRLSFTACAREKNSGFTGRGEIAVTGKTDESEGDSKKKRASYL
jgi:hypothetical protein